MLLLVLLTCKLKYFLQIRNKVQISWQVNLNSKPYKMKRIFLLKFLLHNEITLNILELVGNNFS